MISREIQFINRSEDSIGIPLCHGEIVELWGENEEQIWEKFWHWADVKEEDVKDAQIIGGQE